MKSLLVGEQTARNGRPAGLKQQTVSRRWHSEDSPRHSLVRTFWRANRGYLRGAWLAIATALVKPVFAKTISAAVATFSASILLFAMSSSAYALGVGSAEPESYIGQPLNVRIPLFNVQSPNSLGVTLEADRADYFDVAKLSVVIDRANSQLAVRIRSNETVNEPYVKFKLNLVDGANQFSKEFTVLLNLSSDGLVQTLPVSSPQATSTFQAEDIQAEGIVRTSGTMGPYEWAERGSIPEKFGAVIDGQSLWRVARRINKALGVSQSQMMWSLYEANPDAFSTDSIDSLKAGSFLTIPSYAAATRFTEMQSKRKLDELSSTVVTQSPVEEVVDAEQSVQAEFDLPEEESQSFQLTGIDESPTTTDSSSNEIDPGSQQIISSLADTVNNLSEELVRKDKRIEFLEGQVSELKTFVETSGTSTSTVQPQEITTPAATTEPAINEVESQSPTAANSWMSRPWWHWVLAGLLALFVLGLLLRSRLAKMGRSLNLFGSNDSVAFTPLDGVAAEGAAAPIITPMRPRPEKTKLDYSELTAVDKPPVDDDAVEGISYLELEDDVEFDDDDELELVSVDEIDGGDPQDLTFDERFDKLLEDKDYDFARELLDFARYNEISEDRYHCERLRLFKTMKDEDGFYEYYYEIESKIPDFPTNLQTEISQFVVQLAQQ